MSRMRMMPDIGTESRYEAMSPFSVTWLSELEKKSIVGAHQHHKAHKAHKAHKRMNVVSLPVREIVSDLLRHQTDGVLQRFARSEMIAGEDADDDRPP